MSAAESASSVIPQCPIKVCATTPEPAVSTTAAPIRTPETGVIISRLC